MISILAWLVWLAVPAARTVNIASQSGRRAA
jgi:hypothetical protein